MKLNVVTIIFLGTFLLFDSASGECIRDANVLVVTKPNSIYIDHNDGTISDKETGLMWQKCSLGLSGDRCDEGVLRPLTWQAALAAAIDNQDYDYDDWRLPNKNELGSLIENICSAPAINEIFFPNTSALYFYWSSSPYTGNDLQAWGVGFYEGIQAGRDKDSEAKVRLVRGYRGY